MRAAFVTPVTEETPWGVTRLQALEVTAWTPYGHTISRRISTLRENGRHTPAPGPMKHPSRAELAGMMERVNDLGGFMETLRS